ncbi:hypothetical protein EFP00_13495, partial [Lactiplantibacillus paraplantarum]|nr:hypothetical protein [Lactiplantibacillus paraplantarum]
MNHDKNVPISLDAVRQRVCVLFRPPGLGDNCWNVSRRRFELTHKPRHLKYESYSKPEATHFQLRIIWLL